MTRLHRVERVEEQAEDEELKDIFTGFVPISQKISWSDSSDNEDEAPASTPKADAAPAPEETKGQARSDKDYVILLRLDEDMTFYRDLSHAQRSILGIRTVEDVRNHNRIALGTRWLIDVAHDDATLHHCLYLLLNLRSCRTARIRRRAKQLVRGYFHTSKGLLSTLFDSLVFDEIRLYNKGHRVTKKVLMRALAQGVHDCYRFRVNVLDKHRELPLYY